MLCPYCVKGFTYKTVDVFPDGLEGCDIILPERVEMQVPCEECGGSGHIHCCEGLVCNE